MDENFPLLSRKEEEGILTFGLRGGLGSYKFSGCGVYEAI